MTQPTSLRYNRWWPTEPLLDTPVGDSLNLPSIQLLEAHSTSLGYNWWWPTQTIGYNCCWPTQPALDTPVGDPPNLPCIQFLVTYPTTSLLVTTKSLSYSGLERNPDSFKAIVSFQIEIYLCFPIWRRNPSWKSRPINCTVTVGSKAIQEQPPYTRIRNFELESAVRILNHSATPPAVNNS